MPRVKRGTVRRAKRKKLLGLAKGYYANKSKLYRAAKESVDTAGKYAYVGRKQKKRDFRALWIVRINAAARENGLTYSTLMRGLAMLASPCRPVPHRPLPTGSLPPASKSCDLALTALAKGMSSATPW